MKKYKLLSAALALAAVCLVGCTGDESVSSVPSSSSIAQTEKVYLDKPETVSAVMSQMTLQDKIGQIMWIRCPQEDTQNVIKTYKPGGVVLFGIDFKDKTADEVAAYTSGLQSAESVPLIIATDEEGGDIVRASRYTSLRSSPFLSPSALYQSGGITALAADATEKAAFLKNLGVNVVLAPVADVSQNEEDYIYDRTIGQNAEITAQYIGAAVNAYNSVGFGCCLKHFPGYGNNADTHTGIATDERSAESIRQNDLLPFKAGIEAGAPCVLVSHNIVTAFDNTLPASLSPVMYDLLRNELAFGGVITTDELDMGAIQEFTGGASAAAAAFKAGCDMVMLTDYEAGFNSILQAVQNGEITEQRLDESVERILGWKYDMGLLTA